MYSPEHVTQVDIAMDPFNTCVSKFSRYYRRKQRTSKAALERLEYNIDAGFSVMDTDVHMSLKAT